MARLVDDRCASDADLDVVLGSRVGLLGHRHRPLVRRHYLGRLFATASSLVLRPAGLRHAVRRQGASGTARRCGPPSAAPFTSRWAFDVELHRPPATGGGDRGPGWPRALLARCRCVDWRDVGGSKLAAGAALGAMVDLVRVARALRAWPR